MISLWVVVRESDVEAYAATLLLPSYLAHLQLAPLRLAEQAPVRDGREPLVLTYLGDGRLEHYPLDPRQHALGLIRFLARASTPRIQLPQDDAAWLWPDPTHRLAMRVYFWPPPRCSTKLWTSRSGSRPTSPSPRSWPSSAGRCWKNTSAPGSGPAGDPGRRPDVGPGGGLRRWSFRPARWPGRCWSTTRSPPATCCISPAWIGSSPSSAARFPSTRPRPPAPLRRPRRRRVLRLLMR